VSRSTSPTFLIIYINGVNSMLITTHWSPMYPGQHGNPVQWGKQCLQPYILFFKPLAPPVTLQSGKVDLSSPQLIQMLAQATQQEI
jgi:hypothetical protein